MTQPPPAFDFEDQLPYWINRSSFLMRKEIQDRFAAKGLHLRAEEMAILMHLWRDPGQTPSQIADSTVRDRTTVTRLVDGMVQKGFVAREVDESDRRRVIVTPTNQSHELKGMVIQCVREMIGEMMQGISEPDARTALAVVRAMTNNLLGMRSGQ